MSEPKFQVGQQLIVRHGSGSFLHVVVKKVIKSAKKYWYEFVETEEQFPMFLSETVLLKILHPVLGQVVVDTILIPAAEVGTKIISQLDIMIGQSP